MSHNLLLTLHLLVLCGFVGVTSTYMLVAVLNRMRVRKVRLSWQQGRFGGLPLWPALFIGLSLAFLIYAWQAGHEMQFVILLGYLAGSFFWGVAAYLGRRVFVSAYGLIGWLGGKERTVAWSQVVDYFSVPCPNGDVRFTFFYRDVENARQRFDLLVPARYAEAFTELVKAKVDARFEFAVRRTYGPEALEE